MYTLVNKRGFMSKYIIISILALCIFLFSPNFLYAGGLSTTFVQVKLENLEPGKNYSVKNLKNKTLKVRNTTEGITTDIEIELEKPKGANLAPGYEPIPDLSWIKIQKSYFKKIGPGESAETDIAIKIPKNSQFYGKKYQAYIYSHTAGEETFRMGLMSRILIHTAEK